MTDLRFKVGTVPAPPPPATAPGPGAEAAPEPGSVPGLAQAASSIADPALRSAFLRAMSKLMARRLGKG